VNAAQAIRDAAAKRAALYQYANAHDVFDDLERRLSGIEAEGAHGFALRVLRSYRGELDNPEPVVPDHYRTCALCDQPEYIR